MAKTINYTDKEKLIVNALNGVEDGLTLAELSNEVGEILVSGNINALVKKGNVAVIGEREIEYVAKKKVKVYSFVKAID